jgi:hypothetical protein
MGLPIFADMSPTLAIGSTENEKIHSWVMRHEGRFDQAMEWDERMQREPPSGFRPA